MTSIPAAEIAELFRRLIRKERRVQLAPPRIAWNDVYAGDVHFMIAGYHVAIFNDCDEFDYVDSARAPDGRTCHFDDWQTEGKNPVDLLDEPERASLHEIFRNTT